VLTDDVLSSGTAAETQPTARRALASRYTEAACYARRTRLTDTLPASFTARAALWLAAVIVLAGLVVLDRNAARIAARLETDTLLALRLESFMKPARGSLVAWVASFELILAAYLSLLIYSIRRHRTDDYQGSYRIWLWASAAWLILSVNTTICLDRSLPEAAAHLNLGSPALRTAALWGPAAVAWTVMLWRLAAEMVACRIALAAQLTAFLVWAGAQLLSRSGTNVGSHAAVDHFLPLAFVISYLLLISSLVRYAGHVIRDADGHISDRRPRPETGGRRVRNPKPMADGEPIAVVNSEQPPTSRSAATKQRPVEPRAAGRALSLADSALEQAEQAEHRQQRRRPASRWTDDQKNAGLRDDEQGERRSHRITKADRKKLRKEKDRLRHAA
jgi:hypothetical protein